MFIANNKFDLFFRASIEAQDDYDDNNGNVDDDDDDDDDDIEKDIQTIPEEFMHKCNDDLIVPNSLVNEMSIVSNLRILKSNDHIIGLQTIIRDK